MWALFTLRLRLLTRLAIFSVLILCSLIAKTDVIAKRKANFKASTLAVRAINAALGSSDFNLVISQVTTIADWARVMPDYFPKNSDTVDTMARADIWMNFDDLKAARPPTKKRL